MKIYSKSSFTADKRKRYAFLSISTKRSKEQK